ncbi:hypothetical protein OAF10_01425 [bacterium]|nr:hypothetical protein [bacterium]
MKILIPVLALLSLQSCVVMTSAPFSCEVTNYHKLPSKGNNETFSIKGKRVLKAGGKEAVLPDTSLKVKFYTDKIAEKLTEYGWQKSLDKAPDYFVEYNLQSTGAFTKLTLKITDKNGSVFLEGETSPELLSWGENKSLTWFIENYFDDFPRESGKPSVVTKWHNVYK